MTDDYIAACEQLSVSEIVINLGEDPAWCLPRGCSRWRARMDEAWAVIEAERLGKRPKASERCRRPSVNEWSVAA